MNTENIKKKFISSFHLPKDEFSDPTEFDNSIGFSTQKALNERLRKKLGIPSDKNYISLIHVYIEQGDLDKEQLVQIKIRASLTEKRGDKFFITDEHIKNKKYKPIELISRDDYLYDYKKNYFFNAKEQQIEAINILNDIYRDHTKTSNTFSWLRTRIWFWRSMATLVKFEAKFIERVLYFTSGEKVEFSLLEGEVKTVTELRTEVGTEEKPSKRSDPINFFGYEIAKETISSYSLLHLLIYSLFFVFDIRPPYLTTISRNTFLTANYVIVTLVIFEHIFEKKTPPILKNHIRQRWKRHYSLLFKEIPI